MHLWLECVIWCLQVGVLWSCRLPRQRWLWAVCAAGTFVKKNNKKNTPDKYSRKTTTPHLSPLAASALVFLFICAFVLDKQLRKVAVTATNARPLHLPWHPHNEVFIIQLCLLINQLTLIISHPFSIIYGPCPILILPFVYLNAARFLCGASYTGSVVQNFPLLFLHFPVVTTLF